MVDGKLKSSIPTLNLLSYTCLIWLMMGCSAPKQGVEAQLRRQSPPGTTRAYEEQRRQMVLTDSARAFDASITLTPQEQMANQKLLSLQRAMFAHYDSTHFFPPARSFFKSKDHILATPLYQVLKRMPKGGIHHLHPNAGASFWWIIKRALQEPDCYVYWQAPTKQYIKGQIYFYKKGTAPSGFYPIKALNDSVPDFPNKLYSLLSFDASISKDSVDIWGEFEKRFQRIGGFTSYQPVFEDLYTAMFDSLAVDGVQHVELRAHLGGSLYDLNHPTGSFPADSVIKYYQNAVQRVRTTREPAFSCKLIYSNIRFLPVTAIQQDLKKAFAIRQKYPDMVKGYDLVAQEDKGNSTRFYRDAWLMRDSLSKAYGVDMPLCFHDGESDWEHVTNMYDAVLLNSSRIGHGFNLSFFPTLENLVREKDICIEVSPLSNQILGFVQDLRIHPAHAWINKGIQISISPDDPAIFNYQGVTPDYWSIFLAWELDLRALKKLAMNSITYSHLNSGEKQEAMRVWQKKWEHFIQYVNQTL